MKKKCLYGVDLTKKITPIMVRDAIIDCFIKAHKEILEQMKEVRDFKSKEEFEEMKKINVKMLVEKMFSDIGGDFDNPTKESLIKVVEKLKEYASNFRKPKIIEKHAEEILQLIDRLDDN